MLTTQLHLLLMLRTSVTTYLSTPTSCLRVGHRDKFTLCMYHKKYEVPKKSFGKNL